MLFQINSVVSDHLAYSDVTVTDLPAEWVLIADEGEMKVYRMELEEDGIVVDPTKAVHTVRVRLPALGYFPCILGNIFAVV